MTRAILIARYRDGYAAWAGEADELRPIHARLLSRRDVASITMRVGYNMVKDARVLG